MAPGAASGPCVQTPLCSGFQLQVTTKEPRAISSPPYVTSWKEQTPQASASSRLQSLYSGGVSLLLALMSPP